MIAAKRTSRDFAGCILPVIAFFALMMTYISLVDPSWIALPIALGLWILLTKYIFGLIYPTTYITEVFPDRVVLSDSSKPENPTVYLRIDVGRFYIQPQRWWHNADAIYPVLCEMKSGQTITISWNYVYDENSAPFFAAVREMWGDEYVRAHEA